MVTLVSMAMQGYQERMGCLAALESQGKSALKELLVCMEQLVSLDYQGLQEGQEPLAHQELMALLACRVHQERLAALDPLDPLGCRVHKALMQLMGLMEMQDREVSQDLKEKKESEVVTAPGGSGGHQGRKALKVLREDLVCLGAREIPVQWEAEEVQGQGELLENRDKEGKVEMQASVEELVVLVRKERRESLVERATEAQLAEMERKEKRVLLDWMVIREFQESEEIGVSSEEMVIQETGDLMDLQDQPVAVAILDILGPLDHKVIWVTRDTQDWMAPQGTRGTAAPRVCMEARVPQALRAQKVPLDRLVLEDHLELQGEQVPWVPPALLGRRGLKVIRAGTVILEKMVTRGDRVLLALLVRRESRVLMEKWASRGSQGTLECKVHVAI